MTTLMRRSTSLPDAFHAKVLPEVDLTFGGGQQCHDQKAGITNFGPYSDRRSEVRVGVIGDHRTTEQFLQLVEMARHGVPGKGKHPLWTQDFPGLDRGAGYRFELVAKPEWVRVINPRAMQQLEKMAPKTRRISESVRLFMEVIKRLKEREEVPGVFVCAPPEDMMRLCIPKEGEQAQGPKGRVSKFEKKHPSVFVESQQKLMAFSDELQEYVEEEWQRDACDNFHHALKIAAMKEGVATQFIKPFTLDRVLAEEVKGIQDPATVCWNLFNACYYKAGGIPWQLPIQQGTCFIGIAFFKEKIGRRKMGTSLAQVFTHDGEGLVVRGESFEWPRYTEPHLSRAAMKRLIDQALDAYETQMDIHPTRVVIHKTSAFDDAEREAAESALEDVPRYDLLAIRQHHDHKVFRSGYNPPIRGTVITMPDERRLLFTKGYIPSMQVYPGPRVPRPIEIQFDRVSSSKDQLCREILGLTRLNWNSADFASHLPMTLEFAHKVNRILREMPPGSKAKSRYRYYM